MRILSVLAALVAAALLSIPAAAEEKAKDKEKSNALAGAFSKKAGDYELTFDFKKDTFNFKMISDANGCEVDFKYTRDKDGLVKGELTKFTKKGDFPVEKEKGYKLAFKAKIDGKKLVISDVDGEGIDDEAKNVFSGEYEPAPK
jgi:hypothetical protein